MIINIFTCFLSCVEAVSKSGSKFINCRWITLENMNLGYFYSTP